MIHFTSSDIKSALSYKECTDTMMYAFSLKDKTDYFMPERTHIDFDGNTLLLMPCFGNTYFSTKMVSLVPSNRERKMPPLSGLVILNDRATGQVLATFDAAELTSRRTAGVVSAALRLLAGKDDKSLGIIGLGVQGINQAIFACKEHPFRKVNIFDSSGERAKIFIESFQKECASVPVNICNDSKELVKESNVIITATDSEKPVLPDNEDLLRGKCILAIGSYRPVMRELPDTLFRLADYVFVDTLHAITESGDLIYPLENNILKTNRILNISVLPDRNNIVKETRVFKSVGMALFDLLAAIQVYEKRMGIKSTLTLDI